MNAQAPNSFVVPVSITFQFQRELVALIPQLRAFSRTLCGRRGLAEDMAQDALAKAWRARERFEPGTNLKAWLFTILRNEFYSHARRAWREVHWDAEKGENIAGPANEQDWAVELSDLARALRKLPEHQREALILVSAGGFSYADTAKISGARIGTVKSRVARARLSLSRILAGDRPLPRHNSVGMMSASNDILAQIDVLSSPVRDVNDRTVGQKLLQ